MPEPSELSYGECRSLLATGEVGRVAVSTPMGPRIVSVGYTVVDDAVVFRTPPHSLLGTYAQNTTLAFEVDLFDLELREGWSVVAVGRASLVTDADELSRIDEGWDPGPWGSGRHSLCFKMRWTELTGHRLGDAAA